MENTEINKVKFFAQYWGQKVFVNPVLTPNPVSNIYIFEYSEPEDIEVEYLLLKPISSITDEDKIGLGYIIGIKRSIIDNVNDYLKEREFGDSIEQHELDYLRSKGYALPWMGLTVDKLVEYGWIKLSES